MAQDRPMPNTDSVDHYLKQELDALFRQEDVLALLDDGILDGIWYWDLQNPEHEYMSPGFWRTFGFDPDLKAHLASEWQSLIFPEDGVVAAAKAKSHMANPEFPYDQVVRYTTASGAPITIRCRGKAFWKDGAPHRMLGIHTVVADHKQTAVERQVEQMIQSATSAIISWTEETGIETWNNGATQMYGTGFAQAHGRPIFETTSAVLPEPWEDIQKVIKETGEWNGIIPHKFRDGRQLITMSRIMAAPLEDGRQLYLKTSRDDTERQSLAQRNELLLREMKHRVQNLFAIVQAIIRVSARKSPEAMDYATDLQARVGALAAAHTASLALDAVGPVDLRDLVSTILEPHRHTGDDLKVVGPELLLSVERLTSVGLILHELATNSVKHGSWSLPGHPVHLQWDVEVTEDHKTLLRIVWREALEADKLVAAKTGLAEAPGFGSDLIHNSARQLGGEFTREFEKDTMCSILTFHI